MKYVSLLLLVGGMFLILAGVKERMTIQRLEKSSLESATLLIETVQNKRGTVQGSNKLQKEMEAGDVIGILIIPDLGASLPIVEGTHEDELKKGVGHMAESALPGEQDQVVLSGHRDTVFRQIGSLTIGNRLMVQMADGEYVYEISSSKVVDADDRTVITSTWPNEELMLTTCYPFTYIGNAPERYIIKANRIE